MCRRIRKEVNDQNTKQYKADPQNSGKIEFLAKRQKTDCCDKDDAKGRPYSINNADWHRFESQRQQVKGNTVANNNND